MDIADFDLFEEECEDGNPLQISGLPPLEDAVDELEEILVRRALARGGNTRRAAELLQVSQSTIMRKIRKFSLDVRED